MNILIVEDEYIASERLADLVKVMLPESQEIAIVDSVNSGLAYFNKNELPDLMFLDIQLNDGYGFDILDKLDKHPPVIFTTAYNEYAIRGFKYNGVDYLLKPIDKDDLKKALAKFRNIDFDVDKTGNTDNISAVKDIMTKDYKRRFMVRVGNHFSSYEVDRIHYFYSDEGTIYLCTDDGKSYPVEYSLDQLEDIMNPIDFFRISRQYLVSLKAVKEIHNYFNGRLLLKLQPVTDSQVIVARKRCADFKRWLDI